MAGRRQSLQYLVDLISGSIRPAFPDADRHDPVEPFVAISGGFEEWRNTQIVVGARNRFAARDAAADLRWAVPHAAIGHENQGAVIGSQHQAHVLLERP